jgi:predicted ferric reductase
VIARLLALFILIHPFLYTLPMSGSRPWDPTGASVLNLDSAGFITGGLAWLLLPVFIALALFRRDLPYRYETWRLMHGLGAALIAILTLHHALDAGRYSSDPALTVFWVGMTGAALGTLFTVYILRPLHQLRRPYRVETLEKIAAKTWRLVIRPIGEHALSFRPGQFIWLTLNRPPFAITEHPFSISSCPAQGPRLEFTIKEAGDFTNRIGTLPVGARAWIDGPHGSMILPADPAVGLTFIAGGVGMAPIMSMLRQLRADGDTRPITVIYGNRAADQIMYRPELDEMTRELDLAIHYVLSEPPPDHPGPVGMIDEAMLRRLVTPTTGQERMYIVCGPTPMIDGVAASLGRLGVPASHIRSEKFSYD